MEEDRTSEAVVIPDISEPLTNETEEHASLTSEHHQSVAQVSVSVASVPVSVPVGSLIGVASSGTTFNVITPEQLQNGELKATHIVIQGDPGGDAPDTPTTPSTPTNPLEIRECPNTWNESVHMPILPVRCKNTSAELHKGKFGSGGRGRCVKLADCWYTPSEFEALCGRASSKDWKRSIRFGGRSLQTLIDEGILTPHATSCTCSACCDDQSASGPVRLFTPYKRRRRKDLSDSDILISRKLLKIGSSKEVVSTEEDSDTTDSKAQDEPWRNTTTYTQRTLTDGMVIAGTTTVAATTAPTIISASQPTTASEEGLHVTDYQPIVLTTQHDTFKKLEEMSGKMLRIALQFRHMIEDTKEKCQREMEEMREHYKREKEQAVLAARVETQVACTRAVFEPRADGLPVHVVDPLDTVGLQPTDASENRKCANCNREAFAECSLCRRTPYCSTFCQRKDWASHQVECVRSATDPTMGQTTSSIMLIVESSEQVLTHAPQGHTGAE